MNLYPTRTVLKVDGNAIKKENWMRYIPAPLLPEEIVTVVEHNEPRWIKVKHNKGKSVSTFDVRYFRQPRKKTA